MKLTNVIDKHNRMILQMAHKQCKFLKKNGYNIPSDYAQDLYHDGILKICESYEQYDDKHKWSTFIHSCIAHRYIDLMKPMIPTIQLTEEMEYTLHISNNEFMETIKDCVMDLPEIMQQIINERYIKQEKLKEIGRTLNMHPNGISRLNTAALQKLRKMVHRR